jgi:hypothetical protein
VTDDPQSWAVPVAVDVTVLGSGGVVWRRLAGHGASVAKRVRARSAGTDGGIAAVVVMVAIPLAVRYV